MVVFNRNLVFRNRVEGGGVRYFSTRRKDQLRFSPYALTLAERPPPPKKTDRDGSKGNNFDRHVLIQAFVWFEGSVWSPSCFYMQGSVTFEETEARDNE